MEEQKESEKNLLISDFDWTSYLECQGMEGCPESAFLHVEASLDTGVREGMIVERPLDTDPNTFWLASIDSVYGPLLKLSWLGDDDLLEIWHDLSKEKLYPLGYCQMRKLHLEAPVRIAEFCPLWQTVAKQYLEDPSFDTILMHFIENEGIIPIDRIRTGMGVQVQCLDGTSTYQAKIVANHGGLLHLQDLTTLNEEWLFYSHPRIGYDKTTSLKKPPRDVIKPLSNKEHDLEVGQAIEIILDGDVKMAKIQKVLEDKNLKIELQDKTEITVNALMSYNILPPGTFHETVEKKENFEKFTTAEELGFDKDQRLMLLHNKEFHPCTVKSVKIHVLVLNIDTLDDKEFKISIHDPNIFPLQWTSNHGLEFHIPKSYQKIKEVTEEEKQSKNEILEKVEEAKEEFDEKSSSWCPPVFFNYKCYSASFLSRTRLAGLPKKVGPGPVQLVVREVLNLIIGSSFKSGSVLKRLEAKKETANVDFVIEELKGKSRVLNLKANIEIPTKTHQVDKYLREMCQKLSACPNMVATKLYQGVCPVDCHNRPKTEFREDDGQNVKSEAPKVPRKRGKKRKHPDALLVEKANLPTSSDDSSSSRPSSPTASSSIRKKRSKEWGTILPKSEIRTRGAKLPNFSLHMKIRPSRKEQRAIENSSSNVKSYSASEHLLSKTGGKKGRRELPPAFSLQDFPQPPPPIRTIRLKDNPENWTAYDTAKFIGQTSDCGHLARFIVEDDIDGPAFMLLNYPTVKEYWKLKRSTAISLCRHIESVILAYKSIHCQ